jgi:hypothetical protein
MLDAKSTSLPPPPPPAPPAAAPSPSPAAEDIVAKAVGDSGGENVERELRGLK